MEVLSEVLKVLVEECKDDYFLHSQPYEGVVCENDVQYPKIDPGYKYFIEAQFVSYSISHDDRIDKLDYCSKYIDRTEIDRDGLFKDFPDVKSNLLQIFKVERDSLRKAIYDVNSINDYSFDFLEIFGQIKRSNDAIAELQRSMNSLLDIIKTNKRKGAKKTTTVGYKDIFINEKIAVELKNLFQVHGFTDKGSWKGQTGAKNELAIAYYILKDPAYGFHLIKPGNKKNQLMALYNELGLKVAEKANQITYTSIRNLTTEPTRGETHDEFIRIFKPLLQMKI